MKGRRQRLGAAGFGRGESAARRVRRRSPSACDGAATAISWISLLDSLVDQCKVALMMHETGHTFSLKHVDDKSAVMNPVNTCSINFRSQSRAQIKNYVQANAGSFGCSCALML